MYEENLKIHAKLLSSGVFIAFYEMVAKSLLNIVVEAVIYQHYQRTWRNLI